MRCAVTKFRVISSYFFQEQGVTDIVNSNHYVFSMLNTFLLPKMEQIAEEEDLEDLWLDGATPHMAQNSLNVLRTMFPGCLVSLRSNVRLLAWSPDLSIFLGAT